MLTCGYERESVCVCTESVCVYVRACVGTWVGGSVCLCVCVCACVCVIEHGWARALAECVGTVTN
jgi:hypothetical protein